MDGPFIVQEQAGVDRTYWCAIDPATGIVLGGERDKERAFRFRDALNAAYFAGIKAASADNYARAASGGTPQSAKPR